MLIKDKITLTSTQRKYTDEGFLQVPAKISRIGIQDYFASEMGVSAEPNKIIKVYRPSDEVFNQDSLNSFASKPVTNNHPPVLVTSKNSKTYSVGLSSPEVTHTDMYVETVLNITDQDAIDAINSGKVELSNGYTCDIDWTPGVTPDGQKYDAVQRNIKGNHIAIVERGRAGAACRLADNLTHKKGDVMSKITIDGVDFEVSEQAAQAISKLQKALKDAEEEMKEKDEEMEKKKEDMEEKEKDMKKTEDSLKAKIDDLQSKLPTSAQLDKMVADRIALVTAAKSVSDVVCDGKTADEIMKEVVADKCPSVQLDSVSGDYIKARFDMLVESASSNPQFKLDQAVSKTVASDQKNTGDKRPASVIAREKMIADARNAYKFGSVK